MREVFSDRVVRVFWMFVHNCLVHPAMGLVALVTLDYWQPYWLDEMHDLTARRAFPR